MQSGEWSRSIPDAREAAASWCQGIASSWLGGGDDERNDDEVRTREAQSSDARPGRTGFASAHAHTEMEPPLGPGPLSPIETLANHGALQPIFNLVSNQRKLPLKLLPPGPRLHRRSTSSTSALGRPQWPSHATPPSAPGSRDGGCDRLISSLLTSHHFCNESARSIRWHARATGT